MLKPLAAWPLLPRAANATKRGELPHHSSRTRILREIANRLSVVSLECGVLGPPLSAGSFLSCTVSIERTRPKTQRRASQNFSRSAVSKNFTVSPPCRRAAQVTSATRAPAARRDFTAQWSTLAWSTPSRAQPSTPRCHGSAACSGRAHQRMQVPTRAALSTVR
jgi:hypothetical protein